MSLHSFDLGEAPRSFIALNWQRIYCSQSQVWLCLGLESFKVLLNTSPGCTSNQVSAWTVYKLSRESSGQKRTIARPTIF